MKRRQCYIIAAVAGLGLAVALLLQARAKPQPQWQGKRVSEWFGEFRKAKVKYRTPIQLPAAVRLRFPPGSRSVAPPIAYYDDTDALMHDPVADAFRSMGTNAVPFLVAQIKRRDPRWATTYSKFYFKFPRPLQRLAPAPPTTRDFIRSDAALALAAMGPSASSAVPAVMEVFATEPGMGKSWLYETLRRLPLAAGAFDQALENFRRQGDIMEAVNTVEHFRIMTAAAACVLTNAIFSTNSTARTKALLEARRFGDHASVLLPALIATLESADGAARQIAACDLQAFGSEAAPALPALVNALQSKDEELRYQAVRAMETQGTNALPAVPALTAVTNDANVMVRRVARRILQNIGNCP